MAYAFLAGDDALPDHEVDGPTRQRLRLRHEPLNECVALFPYLVPACFGLFSLTEYY